MTDRPENLDDNGYANVRIAELYDTNPVYGKRKDTDYYVETAKNYGGPVLELGCGTGRVLLAIAREGITITGMDRSRPMLEVLQKKLDGKSDEVQERISIVENDMRSFDLSEKNFRLAIIPFRPFQHLIRIEDQLACLQCINRHLAPGGCFVLDLFQTNPRYIYGPENMVEREDFTVTLEDGTTVRRTHRLADFHLVEQYNDVELIHYVTPPGRPTERVVQSFPFRYFFRYEVEHLLARCGFRILETYGNFDRSPLSSASPEMIFVTEKIGVPSK